MVGRDDLDIQDTIPCAILVGLQPLVHDAMSKERC